MGKNCDRCFPSVEDALGIRHAHLAHRVQQDVFALWHCGFGRPVQRGFQLIDPFALTEIAQQFGCIIQVAGQRDAHFGVGQETVRPPQAAHCRQRPFFKCRAHGAGSIGVAEIVQAQCVGTCPARPQNQRDKRLLECTA
jgi:hypothetical protein